MKRVYKEVADELGISEELVNFVGRHIGTTIRSFIKNPTKYEFLINGFAVITPRLYSLEQHIERLDTGVDDINKYPEENTALCRRIVAMGQEHKKQQKQNGKNRNKHHQKEQDHE